jgi:HEAT repeats
MRDGQNKRLLSIVLPLATLVTFLQLPGTISAGIFSKKTKPNPAERVPTLIATLRVDADERKRSSAAEELKQYDPAMFPEIIPTLAEAAQHDSKSGVRLEAIQSLAKLRPITQRAGAAIEQATHDDSMRVRMQARTLLWQYHLAGYKASKTPDITIPSGTIHTEEPPLAVQQELPSVSTFQKPVPTAPTVGYVSPATPPSAPQSNLWGATTMNPNPLPAQPKAVPLGPRPLSSGPAQVQSSAPQPLPAGPAKPVNNTPKPLPQGPMETGKPMGEGTFKEPPLAPQKDDGPDLP